MSHELRPELPASARWRLPAGALRGLLAAAVLLLAVVAGLGAARAQPARAVHDVALLDPQRPDVDVWPAVTMLHDLAGTLDADTVRRRGDFVRPDGPGHNLGQRDGAVWLRLRVAPSEEDDGRWLLEIDYPPLDRADVVVTRSDGLVVARQRLGDEIAFADRVVATRPHAMRLVMTPGVEHEVLLRVQTRGTLIVPLRMVKPSAFQAREARLQMLQGVAAGVHLCLIAYALLRASARRERFYVHYALWIAGSALFTFSFFGLGAQHLWPGSAWFADLAPLIWVLVALAGALWVVDGLFPAGSAPHLVRTTRIVGAAAALGALAVAAGALDYGAAQQAVRILGPLPLLVVLPIAWTQWRRADRAARGILVGWGASAAGATVLSLLLQGWIPDTTWTLHGYQFGALLQAAAWLRVLDLRDAEHRERADRADRERTRLQALADSDALTGLPNRRGLERALAAGLAAASVEDPLALYLLDLDGFKEVNDALGHDAGDRLLVAVARRLRETLRHEDLVGRLGGDEFVVLANGLRGADAAAQFGERLVRAFDEPFDLGDGSCRIGLTVGFVVAPEDGADAATLLRGADAAMYAGKRGGRHTVRRVAAPA